MQVNIYLESHRGGKSEPAGLRGLRKQITGQITEAKEGPSEFRGGQREGGREISVKYLSFSVTLFQYDNLYQQWACLPKRNPCLTHPYFPDKSASENLGPHTFTPRVWKSLGWPSSGWHSCCICFSFRPQIKQKWPSKACSPQWSMWLVSMLRIKTERVSLWSRLR